MGSDRYFLGMMLGVAMGVGVGTPSSSDIVVDLDRQTAKSIKTGKLSAEQQNKLCLAYEKAISKYRKEGEEAVTICLPPKSSDTPRPQSP